MDNASPTARHGPTSIDQPGARRNTSRQSHHIQDHSRRPLNPRTQANQPHRWIEAERRDHATARVAVIDPLPMFREGVATVLSAAGHHVETPADPVGWAAQGPSALVLLTMAGTPQWRLLVGLREAPVIALIDGGSPTEGAR